MLWEACVALLSKEKEVIKNDYFRVWDIVELLYKKTDNNWDEVGQFLGHYNFDTELTLYRQDAYCRINEVNNNYLPIRKLIDGLNMTWIEGEESVQKIKFDIIGYYWHKNEIYNFKPIMDLGIIAEPSIQVATVQPAQESQPDRYKFFLYKQPLFSIDECACIISDYDPLEILRYSSGDIDEIAPDYSRAYSFVNSSVEAGKLNIFNYKIDADNFKNYLASENIIITGFNDQISEPLHTELTEEHTELKTTIANLELDLAIEKTKVEKLNEEIDHLKAHIAKIENEKMQFQYSENAILDKDISLENSDLILISVLLKMLQDEIKIKSHKSQARILQKIEDSHSHIKGLSKSRTEKLMGKANRIYKQLNNKEMQ